MLGNAYNIMKKERLKLTSPIVFLPLFGGSKGFVYDKKFYSELEAIFPIA